MSDAGSKSTRRPGAIRRFRASGPAVRVLVLNQLSFNLGFYMVLPYLAVYLGGELGFAAWAVGLVLGVRAFSQQGLFVVGGSLADRIGYKPVIVAGCLLRTVGFWLFGVFASLPGILLAAVLSGFAAALFSPAVEAYLAHESEEERTEAFALFQVFGEVGALLGPLVGVALLGFDFRLVCAVAGSLFLGITAAQILYLPAREGGEAGSEGTVLADWKEALTNGPFVVFALGMSGYYVLFNQLYLGLPFEVGRLTGGEAGVGLMFALSSLLYIAAQMRTTTLFQDLFRPQTSVCLGLALMGLAFLPPLLATPLLPVGGTGALSHAANLSPVVLSAALLTLGMMVAKPFAMGLIPGLSGGRRLGTYYGLLSVAGGIAAAVGNSVSGLAFDLARAANLAPLPWLLMLLVGGASAATILSLDRRGKLPPEDALAEGKRPRT